MDNFQQYLHSMRTMHRMSQEEMARYLGLSTSCIQKWEQGRRTPKRLTQQAVEQRLRKLI